jgi:hypothetical protein
MYLETLGPTRFKTAKTRIKLRHRPQERIPKTLPQHIPTTAHFKEVVSLFDVCDQSNLKILAT